MHRINIPGDVVERVIARYGTEHPHADLDPARTALVVIDLQNGFMKEGVAHALVPAARDIVPNVNRIAAALREAGGRVFWIRNTHDDRCLADWSAMNGRIRPEMRDRRAAASVAGSEGHALWPALDVRTGDAVVDKFRYSAFIHGSSDLPERLCEAGVETVIIVGTATNVCCDSSARDAMMLNFRTIMVSDANAASTDEEHNAALRLFYLMFGDVMTTDFVIARLNANAAAAA